MVVGVDNKAGVGTSEAGDVTDVSEADDEKIIDEDEGEGVVAFDEARELLAFVTVSVLIDNEVVDEDIGNNELVDNSFVIIVAEEVFSCGSLRFVDNCLVLLSLNCLQPSATASIVTRGFCSLLLLCDSLSAQTPISTFASCMKLSAIIGSSFTGSLSGSLSLRKFPLRLSTGVAITDDVVDVEFEAVFDDDDSEEVFGLYVS